MKKIKSIILVLLIALVNLPQANASFIDVSNEYKNKTAIEYLQTNNIIQGYSDGTFRPEQAINRVEFLKIVLEGSKIPLDKTKYIPLKDLDFTAWYIPYVRKAYLEGWVNGYGDGTFKPNQTINKVEALKIIGKVQGWNLAQTTATQYFTDTQQNAWYSPYVQYAKEHNFLEDQGTLLHPDQLMTRANISEIIYRSFSGTTFVNQQTETPIIVPIEPTTNTLFFTPNKVETIKTDYFDKITLKNPLPNTFYANEVYIIEGTINSGIYTTATALVQNEAETNTQNFTAKVVNNQISLPIYFKNSGNYYLGLIPGNEGTAKLTKISVLPTLPKEALSENDQSSSYFLSHLNDSTKINVSSPKNILKKVEITQGSKKVTYINRQDVNSIPVSYKDFAGFTEGNITYRMDTVKISGQNPLSLTSSFKIGQSKTEQITTHKFSQIEADKINANPLSIQNQTGSISFSGTVFTNTRQKALVINPAGFVEDVTLTTSSPLTSASGAPVILSGGQFSFNYSPKTSGTYIVEINDDGGVPTLNHSVYINNGIPLIPDFFDLNERTYFNKTFNITSLRNEMLNEINASRNAHGLTSIVLSSELNSVAQEHSNDMATNNYFAHINPKGQSPNDRRLAAGISTPISENLAKDVSIKFAHEGLMRSAGHRDNILQPQWERVGIGVTEKDGYLYVTQEFATNQLTPAKLQGMEDELFIIINSNRSDRGLSQLIKDPELVTVITYLNDLAIQTSTQLSNSLFSETLDLYNIDGTSEAILKTNQIWPDLLKSILADEIYIYEQSWAKIGIDVNTDNYGVIRAGVITNRP